MTPPFAKAREFSRVFKRTDLPPSGRDEVIVATPEECTAVAGRLGLMAVEALSARLQLRPWRRDGLAVTGTVEAEIVQTCVVSLEEFSTTVHESVGVRFADEDDPLLAREARQGDDIFIDPLGDDAPEILTKGVVDLGELAVEHLAVALDPHPRRPGVAFSDEFVTDNAGEQGAEERRQNPFAILESLKRSGDET